jgi:hypothetical protein
MSRRALPLVLLLFVVACPSRQVRPTPAPPFAGKPIDSVSTADVIAYAGTLQFDSTRPASDTLTVNTPTGDTVRMEVEPEIGSGALSKSDVAAGRIIARVHSSVAFPPLGLGAGTTYFWVDGDGDRAHGVMIPADSAFRRFMRPLIVRDHLPAGAPVTARFVVVENGGVRIYLINGRCGVQCCSFGSDFGPSSAPMVDSAITEMHKHLTGAQ